jgi:exopolysaccharide production protein ExoZ
MREVLSIQYLRAVAATMVVVYHVLNRMAPAEAQNDFWVAVWASGVDVFFVVSGFVMWTTTAGRSIEPVAFWRARLVRIVPLYWLALAACWVTLAARHGLAEAPDLVAVVKAATFVPHVDPHLGTVSPYLTSGWTLTHEMIFYAVFGAALTVRRPEVRLAAVTAVLTVMVAGRFVFGGGDPIVFRLTSPLAFEFLAGVGLAVLHRRFSGHRAALPVGLAAAAFAVVFVATITRAHPVDWPRVVVFGVPATAVVLAAVACEARLRRVPIGWLKRLGDASYSLYLANDVFQEIIAPTAAALAPPLEVIVLFGGSMFAGAVVHRLVEQPIARSLSERRRGVAERVAPA